jgi:hypothetical protein
MNALRRKLRDTIKFRGSRRAVDVRRDVYAREVRPIKNEG